MRNVVDVVKEEGRELVEQTAEEASAMMARNLEAAITPTGLRRQAGERLDPYGHRQPGRLESGEMIEEINSSFTDRGDTLEGKWGWPNPKDYFIEQEHGTAKIAAANSIETSFLDIGEIFHDRVAKLAGGEDWRD